LIRFVRFVSLLVILGLAALALPGPAGAFPPLPSSFYGKITLDGADVPEGTRLEAWIGDLLVAFTTTEMYQGDSVYSLDIAGDDTSTQGIEGGVEGDVIYFKLAGFPAGQTATWRTGTNEELDLSAISTVATNTPLPTPTELPADSQQDQARSTATAQAAVLAQPTQAPGDIQASEPGENTIYLPEAQNAGEAEATATFRPGVVEIVDESYPPTATPEPGAQPEQNVPPSTAVSQEAGTISWIWVLVPVFFLCLWLFGLWFLKRKKAKTD
jgi:hypothetical protein